jgi:hypothetical protein
VKFTWLVIAVSAAGLALLSTLILFANCVQVGSSGNPGGNPNVLVSFTKPDHALIAEFTIASKRGSLESDMLLASMSAFATLFLTQFSLGLVVAFGFARVIRKSRA